MDYKIEYFEKFSDSRGDLMLFLKKSDLKKDSKTFGQIYFVTFKRKNTIRANHYHKKLTEWVGLVEGKVEVVLKDIKSGEEKTIILDANSKENIRLKIGPYIAHGFKCLSSKAFIINYTDCEWSKDDVYPYEVISANYGTSKLSLRGVRNERRSNLKRSPRSSSSR